MKKFIILFLMISAIGVMCVPLSADSLLINNISHAGSVPILDASSVPDGVYGDTVIMYVKTPMLDDVIYEDLSDFSGSFYSVWRDGKLYFHLMFKDFSDGDSFDFLFDLVDSNHQEYGMEKTVKVSFSAVEGSVLLSSVESVESSANVESFKASANVVSVRNGDDCCIELSLDFTDLYEDFSFGSGKKIGFDIVVSNIVDGGVVRYVWNDDTGNMLNVPDDLGTFVMKAPIAVEEVEGTDDSFETDDGNPGTSDSCFLMTWMFCLASLSLSAWLYRLLKTE